MILTDYYCFERVAQKSKSRMDCTVSTFSYPEFEEKRSTKAYRQTENRDGMEVGSLVMYYGRVSDNFKEEAQRKAGMSITMKGKNLSSVFVPDPTSPYGYGDVSGTSDAILFILNDVNVVDGAILSGAKIEVFIARGKSKDRVPIYNLLSDGELDEEMEALRNKAVTKSVTLPNQ